MYVSGIYAIINTVTSDMYVGSAVCMARRWNVHKHHLRRGTHHCTHLQNAYNKRGSDTFTFEIVEIVENVNDLIRREQFWIDFFSPKYNKRKIANSCIGVKRSPEFCAHMSNIQRGRKQSAETIAKRAAALRGRSRPEHVRAKISASRMGVKPSLETRAKLSAAKKQPVLDTHA